MPTPLRDIGLVGLAVMGQNLARNMASRGARVVVYNRTEEKTREFMASLPQEATLHDAYSLQELVASLARPRRVFLMVKAGLAVDAVIEELAPLLEPGDLIMDGGNSHYKDTERRREALAAKGLGYLGVGVSGGEEGALHGPSIMPGGDEAAWREAEPLLTAIAAQADDDTPCVAYMGRGGAGHFVKMAHNGIEYADMQLIAEAYDLLHRGAGMRNEDLAALFRRWNETELSSYLIEITGDIFTVQDEETGGALLDVILDSAGQKGTGRWTSMAGLEFGVSMPTINAAVEARQVSSYTDLRAVASGVLAAPWGDEANTPPTLDAAALAAMTEDVRQALYAAKICAYAQGFHLIRAADEAHGWGVRPGEAARIWRAGCIIRAAFLDRVTQAFEETPELPHLLLAPYFADALALGQAALRRVTATAAQLGAPAPAMSSALAYYDALRSVRLPANLIQAQRDYFGAHTYQRVDRAGVFHTEWLEKARRRDGE